jgi:signal transduction histidine kinase
VGDSPGTIAATIDDTGQQITWTVADIGIGIPAAERPRLFRRSYRASAIGRHQPHADCMTPAVT